MSCVTSQPSLRDFGYLLRNPTLERVGYSQISLREIGVHKLRAAEHASDPKPRASRIVFGIVRACRAEF